MHLCDDSDRHVRPSTSFRAGSVPICPRDGIRLSGWYWSLHCEPSLFYKHAPELIGELEGGNTIGEGFVEVDILSVIQALPPLLL